MTEQADEGEVTVGADTHAATSLDKNYFLATYEDTWKGVSATDRDAIERLKQERVWGEWFDPANPIGPDSGMNAVSQGVVTTYEAKLKPVASAGFQLGANGRSHTDDIVPQLCRVSTIRSLNLDQSGITDNGLSLLASHRCIRQLFLDDTNITDQGLKELSKLATLQRLSVDFTRVTGLGIASLRGLPNLELIDAIGTKISDLVLDGGFPNLQEIGLRRCPLRSVRIRNLPRLKGIHIAYCEGVTVDIENLSDLRQVTDYAYCDERGKPHVILRNLPRLEDVRIRGVVRDVDVLTFVGLPRLRSLEIDLAELSDRGLSCLAQFKELELLQLRRYKADSATEKPEELTTTKGFDFLRSLPKLRKLIIESDAEDGIPQIAELQNLTELELRGKCVRHDTWSTLKKTLKNLKKIEVYEEEPVGKEEKVHL